MIRSKTHSSAAILCLLQYISLSVAQWTLEGPTMMRGPWSIGAPSGVNVDFDGSSAVLAALYPWSGDPSVVMIELFEYTSTCDAPIVDGLGISAETSMLGNFILAEVSIEKTSINDSSPFVVFTSEDHSTGNIRFCAKLHLVADGDLSVVARKTLFDISFDLTNFEFSVPYWNLLSYDNFKSGWGSFRSGGEDATRFTGNNSKKTRGKGSLVIQDNSYSKSSVYSKDFIDVSSFGLVNIIFDYIVHDFSKKEKFYLEYKGGTSDKWTELAKYKYKSQFSKLKKWYVGDERLNTTGVDDLKIRFRCHASDDTDKVYIDNVYIFGYGL